jgi:hypothetical protein
MGGYITIGYNNGTDMALSALPTELWLDIAPACG